MKKRFSLLLFVMIVFTLVGCTNDTEREKLENEIDNPEDYYCVMAFGPIEYCTDSEETFNNMFMLQLVQSNTEGGLYRELPLNEAVKSEEYVPLGVMDEYKIYVRDYDVIYTGTHTSSYGEHLKSVEIEIIKYETQYSPDYLQHRSLTMGDMMCMVDDIDYYSYGILVDEQHYHIDAINIFTDLDFTTLELEGFTCFDDTITIDDVTYLYIYKSDTFDIISYETNLEDITGFDLHYYQHEDRVVCHMLHPEYQSKVLKDGQLIDIEYAFEQGIIDIDYYWRYGMKECMTGYYYPFAVDAPFEDPEPEYQYIYEIINEYEVHFYNGAYSIYEEYKGHVYYQKDEYSYVFFEAQLNGVYALKVDDEFKTLQDAIDQELITFDDLIEAEILNVVIYGYYK